MIMSSMFLQGSRIQDTHNVYYYDAPLTFKDVQRIYHISCHYLKYVTVASIATLLK